MTSEVSIHLTEAPARVKAGIAILPVSVTLTLISAVYISPKVISGGYSSIDAMMSSTPVAVMLAGLILGTAALGMLLTEVGGDRNGI